MRLYEFVLDTKLGISIPVLQLEWDEYTVKERSDILYRWEQIRGTIPDRIKHFESQIIEKQRKLDSEESFSVSCLLNSEIADLASCINDLHLWFRINEDIHPAATHQ